MNRRLVHPLWLHAPALIGWVGFAIYSLAGLERWPAKMPIQFGLDGLPSNHGSTGFAIALILSLGALFIAVGVILDELWARQERRKRFNPFTLLDETIVGLMVGAQVGMLEAAASGRSDFAFPWGYAAVFVGGAVLLGILLETLRPAGSAGSHVSMAEIPAMRRTLEAAKMRGETMAYWDIQNPRYVSILALSVPALLWASAAWQWRTSPWSAVLLVCVGGLLLLLYGGQRTRASTDGLSIRYGLLGIRILRLSMDDIVSVEVRRFSPLRDFGGYGIRRNRTMWGYFLRGDLGVVVSTAKGRKVLIGSDHPERLAVVVETMSGCERLGEGMEDE